MKYIFWWLFGAVPVTALCLGIYMADQQVYRQLANDPQIQLAEDAASRLCTGCEAAAPADLVPKELVEIDKSLSPWIVIYDAQGHAIAGDGWINGAYPVLPAGVFDTTNAKAKVDDPIWINGEYRVTWQPRAGVRQAVVIVRAANGYFVAAGRSLRLSEERTRVLGMSMVLGWAATLAGVLVVQLLYVFGRRFARDSARRG